MLLYVIRHGDPVYTPDSLTKKGRLQAEAVAKRLAVHGLDRIYTSPRGHARRTAQPTCDLLGIQAQVEPFMDENFAMERFGIDMPDGKRHWIKDVLREAGYPFVEGITWTTDAFYRETPQKVEARKKQGAICVEMECAAMQALCDFRGVDFFQFLYAGDNLDHSTWDPRSLAGNVRLEDKEKIALLAFELACRMEEEEKCS